MYHVTITDSDGRVVSESDGKTLMLAHHNSTDGGVTTVGICDGGTAKEQLTTIISMELMRDKMMEKNPELLLMYLLKDELIDGREEINLTPLKELLKGRGDE